MITSKDFWDFKGLADKVRHNHSLPIEPLQQKLQDITDKRRNLDREIDGYLYDEESEQLIKVIDYYLETLDYIRLGVTTKTVSPLYFLSKRAKGIAFYKDEVNYVDDTNTKSLTYEVVENACKKLQREARPISVSTLRVELGQQTGKAKYKDFLKRYVESDFFKQYQIEKEEPYQVLPNKLVPVKWKNTKTDLFTRVDTYIKRFGMPKNSELFAEHFQITRDYARMFMYAYRYRESIPWFVYKGQAHASYSDSEMLRLFEDLHEKQDALHRGAFIRRYLICVSMPRYLALFKQYVNSDTFKNKQVDSDNPYIVEKNSARPARYTLEEKLMHEIENGTLLNNKELAEKYDCSKIYVNSIYAKAKKKATLDA